MSYTKRRDSLRGMDQLAERNNPLLPAPQSS
jgi:hypothetical protein